MDAVRLANETVLTLDEAARVLMIADAAGWSQDEAADLVTTLSGGIMAPAQVGLLAHDYLAAGGPKLYRHDQFAIGSWLVMKRSGL